VLRHPAFPTFFFIFCFSQTICFGT